jgi:hypothetical protein
MDFFLGKFWSGIYRVVGGSRGFGGKGLRVTFDKNSLLYLLSPSASVDSPCQAVAFDRVGLRPKSEFPALPTPAVTGANNGGGQSLS